MFSTVTQFLFSSKLFDSKKGSGEYAAKRDIDKTR